MPPTCLLRGVFWSLQSGAPPRSQAPRLSPDLYPHSAWNVRALGSLCPLTERDCAEGRRCQGWVPASAGEDAATGELGGCMTPGDVAGGSRARSLGSFPLQLGMRKPPRPGAEQSHSPGAGMHCTGRLSLRGIWMGK